MCGLFGMMGSGINAKDTLALEGLGIVSQLRGKYGAGLYQTRGVNHTYAKFRPTYSNELLMRSEASWMELLEDIDEFNEGKSFPKMLTNLMADVFIGHVRAPTKGVICEANSHPYMFDNLVGAHNGTFKDPKYEDKTEEVTDSYMFFKDVSERGLINVLGDLDKESAWAITMYDRISGAMFIGRNSKRPLAIAVNKDRQVVYWASEQSFLGLILPRYGIDADIYKVTENTLFKFNPATPKQLDKPKFSIAWSDHKLEEVAA